MKNVLNFPTDAQVEVIDEAYFERYADAALLLKCFEVVKDTLDVINEPEYLIEKEDDTHIDLIRAFYALKVLFNRKTGHDASQVTKDHWEAKTRHLLGGGPPPNGFIPVVTSPHSPLPPEAFDHLTNQEMACAAFNYSDRAREAIMTNSPHALETDLARIHAIDATTVLRKLVLRLSGGSVGALADQINSRHGKTLQ